MKNIQRVDHAHLHVLFDISWQRITVITIHGIINAINQRISHKIHIASFHAAFTNEYIWKTGIQANHGYGSPRFLLILYSHQALRRKADKNRIFKISHTVPNLDIISIISGFDIMSMISLFELPSESISIISSFINSNL